MSKMMWFGTRGRERWVPSPGVDPDYTRSGYANRVDLVNGGASVRESKNAHNVYRLSWPQSKTRDHVRIITDFADGVYDDLDDVNLIYWIDPMSRDKNVLPQAWATPVLGCEDARPLVSDVYQRRRPTAVATPTNAANYPARSAQFTQVPTSVTLEQYIPIPPGFTAWVGVHGDTAGVIQVQPVNGYVDIGSPVVPAVLGASTTRVNTSFDSTVSSGIVLQFVPVVSTLVFTLYGLVVQILPTGTSPVLGDFISGQGHSGCQFIGKPSKSPYSAKLDRVGLSATLEETGMDL